ncbi:serine protein kinase RIO [Candidatus Woesearchaeota archaeon]|nr:serine protein kinase RIO [Candidatus Woesearchaeota archaeon]
MPPITREKFRTSQAVFDNHTERCLFKLSSQGHFLHLESPISIGKEANLFTARKADKSFCIIKIYRVENCDFNKMYDYLKLDPRYPLPKKNRRHVIFTWARREYRNLLKAREAGVRVPTPYAVLDNIIVMELIGDKEAGKPSPKLKDCPPANPEHFFEIIQAQMALLYRAGLIHGDLSKFNILNWDDKPVLIDMSQSTTTEGSNAQELLERDVRNVMAYFEKSGMPLQAGTMIQKITSRLRSAPEKKGSGKRRKEK